MPTPQPMCYVAKEKCGAITGVCIESYDFKKEASKIVARWIRAGRTLEKLPDVVVKENFLKCPKDKSKRYDYDICKNCPRNN